MVGWIPRPWHAAGMAVAPPPPVTLVVGPEPVLVDRAIAEVIATARAVDPGAERRVIDGAGDDAAADIAQAVAPTLFGDGAVVIIESGESLDESALAILTELIAAPIDGVAVVVVHEGKGNKGKKILTGLRAAGAPEITCPALRKGRDTVAFLTAEVRRQGRKATPDALRVLYDAVGHDPRALAGAISQLCADVETDPIDESVVRRYFVGMADVAGYQVADAVWERRAAQALGDLRWVVATQGRSSVGPAVTAALSSGLRAVARVQGMPRGMSDAAIAGEIGMPPWKVKVAMAQGRRWKSERLAAATVRLAGLDVSMKGGLRGAALDPEQKLAALERFVVEVVDEN
jgi:DNA polymerase-3 subunit delta